MLEFRLNITAHRPYGLCLSASLQRKRLLNNRVKQEYQTHTSAPGHSHTQEKNPTGHYQTHSPVRRQLTRGRTPQKNFRYFTPREADNGSDHRVSKIVQYPTLQPNPNNALNRALEYTREVHRWNTRCTRELDQWNTRKTRELSKVKSRYTRILNKWKTRYNRKLHMWKTRYTGLHFERPHPPPC